MSAELDAKWRELVEAGRAKWSPGMLACIYRDDGSLLGSSRHGKPGRDFLPDWDDPATLGALLGQVRARYMDPTIYARPEHVEDGHGWTLCDALGVLDLRGCPRSGPDEVSALLRGLELAP